MWHLSRAEFIRNSLLYPFQCLDMLIWFGSYLYLVSECRHSCHGGSQTPAAPSDSLDSVHWHCEPENRGTGASTKLPLRPQHQKGFNNTASNETSFFSLLLCNIHLYINISRGIFSILPYGQQLLFLPGCHLFSCYFFDFIFKQFNMENSNTVRRTDGEQIQITDFQSHPNRSDWAGVGDKTRLLDC